VEERGKGEDFFVLRMVRTEIVKKENVPRFQWIALYAEVLLQPDFLRATMVKKGRPKRAEAGIWKD